MASTTTRHIAAPDAERDKLTDQATAHLRDLIEARGWGAEAVLHGIASEDRADKWRLAFRRAGRRLAVSVWAVWHYCGQGRDCGNGHLYCERAGAGHCWHLHVRAYRIEDARAFMRSKARRLGWPKRGGQE